MAIAGALIISGGALLGIWLGAVYASGRLRHQLERQAEWLDTRLAREAERFDDQLLMQSVHLARQLNHDRDMRDREALRRTLDEGAVLINKVSSTLTDIDLLLEGRLEPEKREDLIDRRVVLSEELVDYWRRLMIRFQTNDKIPVAVHAVFDGFSKASGFVFRAPQELSPAQREEFEEYQEDLTNAHSEFLEACRARVGVVG